MQLLKKIKKKNSKTKLCEDLSLKVMPVLVCVCWQQTPSGKAAYGADELRNEQNYWSSRETHLSGNSLISKPGFLQPEGLTRQ